MPGWPVPATRAHRHCGPMGSGLRAASDVSHEFVALDLSESSHRLGIGDNGVRSANPRATRDDLPHNERIAPVRVAL
jgi:hypothetical protein